MADERGKAGGGKWATPADPGVQVAPNWALLRSDAALPLNRTHAVWHDSELGADVEWRSRAQRKGRFPRVCPNQPDWAQHVHLPWYRFWGWEPDNVSYWVALLFTLGSAAWVVNGWFLFLPSSDADLNLNGAGWSALVGGTLFTVGAYLGIVEALNVNREVLFGYHVRQVIEAGLRSMAFHPKEAKRRANPRDHSYAAELPHAGAHTHAVVGGATGARAQPKAGAGASAAGGVMPAPAPAGALELDGGAGRPGAHRVAPAGGDGSLGADRRRYGSSAGAVGAATGPMRRLRSEPLSDAEAGEAAWAGAGAERGSAERGGVRREDEAARRAKLANWSWWGFRWHEVGFAAAFVQMLGASLFQVSVVAGVPHLIPAASWQLADALIWTPQVVGAVGFIVASGMLTLETQRNWWRPEPLDIGWHVAFWNLVGAIGFWLSAFFGYFGAEYLRWGVCFSTFWGAWAFLLGSYLQLLEALNKHPLSLREVFKR